MLYPATPHIDPSAVGELGYADELGDLLDAAWPQVDPSALVQDEMELMLQINGKLRGSIRVPAQRRQGRDRDAWRWPAKPLPPKPAARPPSA